jgi:hypothetical protein
MTGIRLARYRSLAAPSTGAYRMPRLPDHRVFEDARYRTPVAVVGLRQDRRFQDVNGHDSRAIPDCAIRSSGRTIAMDPADERAMKGP